MWFQEARDVDSGVARRCVHPQEGGTWPPPPRGTGLGLAEILYNMHKIHSWASAG